MFSEALALLDIFARVWKWLSGVKKAPVESVSARFIRLFETHGVHRNQIPRFFGFGISLEDMQSEALLVKKLDENTLNAACSVFAVRREWLDGADSIAHTVHRFYKNPRDFELFIANLKQTNPDREFMAYVLTPQIAMPGAEALLVLEESVGSVGSKIIYRYHVCDSWLWDYWKARGYLTACVATARRNGLYVHGTYIKNKLIQVLADGSTLLGWSGEGINSASCGRWEAEDLALEPGVFLDGIDPERDGYGIKSSLGLWLELEGEGLMKLNHNNRAKALFQSELEKRIVTRSEI